MPGPKYVNEFEFPASAGFTRSGRGDVDVKSHVRQAPQRFAKGGHVKAVGKPAIGSKSAARRLSPVDTIRGGVRRRREQALGLSAGGVIGRYAEGGRVNGSAMIGRSSPTTELDRVSGGKTPIRPGFRKGGEVSKGEGQPRLTTMHFSKKSPKTAGTGTKKSAAMPAHVNKPEAPRRYAAGGSVIGGHMRRSTPHKSAYEKSRHPHMRSGGKPRYNGGGEVEESVEHEIGEAMQEHVAAPKPRGHGVKKSRGGMAC